MRAVLLAPLLWLLTLPALADARLTVLVDLLNLREAAAILRDEGQAHAETLNRDMLGGQGGPGFQAQLSQIYDVERMVETVRRSLAEGLTAEEMEAATTFFASDLGTRIIDFETEARAAISNPVVDAAARERHVLSHEEDRDKLPQITRLIEAGDMIDRNVSTTLNSNYQFLRGLSDGGAIDDSEADLLASVASELDAVTEDTRGWLYAYMLLAYHPLDAAELSRYADFAETQAGRALNGALFNGFGRAYEDISYALGRAVALNMTAEEL